MIRVLRSHECVCSFRNEIEVGTIASAVDAPDEDDFDPVACPEKGCGRMVLCSRLLLLPIRLTPST